MLTFITNIEVSENQRLSASPRNYGRVQCSVIFSIKKNGSDGWIQIWDFLLNNDYANVYVYNTITREYHSNIQGFQFNYKFNIDASNNLSSWYGAAIR